MARFVDPGAAIYGTGENFEEKLEQQLEDASADLRWLAAELLIVPAVSGLQFLHSCRWTAYDLAVESLAFLPL